MKKFSNNEVYRMTGINIMNLFWKIENVYLLKEEKIVERHDLVDITGHLWLSCIECNNGYLVGDEFFEDIVLAKKYGEAQAYILIAKQIEFLKELLEDLDGGC
jgi:hypothetical protein